MQTADRQSGHPAPGVYPRPAPDGRAALHGISAPAPGELLAARATVRGLLQRTPFELSHSLSSRTGREIHLKLENCGPIRSFKARGALALFARLGPEQLTRGVITASTGNHGQGVAYAAARHGVDATVVTAAGTDPIKVNAMRRLGARLVDGASTLAEAAATAREQSEREGLLYIEDGEDPGLMAGAATVAWEMLEAEPRLDAIIVPVGGGNLVAATLLAVRALKPDVCVIGVQSQAAPGVFLSWQAGEIISVPAETFAGGLGADQPGELALEVMRQDLSHMVVVTEDDLMDAIREFYDLTGFVVEGAAAAPLAALTRFGSQLPGACVGAIVTGGWLGTPLLARALGLESDGA
jgi:threonine dehydratase